MAEIREALGELIFGAGDDELEHVVLSELRRRGESIACLEVGAASWLSDWLLQAAGTADEQLAMAAMQNFAGGISFPTVGQA